jgi:hypothetical protein
MSTDTTTKLTITEIEAMQVAFDDPNETVSLSFRWFFALRSMAAESIESEQVILNLKRQLSVAARQEPCAEADEWALNWIDGQEFGHYAKLYAAPVTADDSIIVPVVPTEAMRSAGIGAIQEHYSRDGGWCGLIAAQEQMALCWQAMIEARPK